MIGGYMPPAVGRHRQRGHTEYALPWQTLTPKATA